VTAVRLSLRARTEALDAAIEAVTGVSPEPGVARSGQDGVRVIWREPGARLLIGDPAAALALQIEKRCGCTVTKVGSGLMGWTVTGASWPTLIEQGAFLDIALMTPGFATATRYGAFDVLIDVTGHDQLRFYAARSMAQDLDEILRRNAGRMTA
jgi:sarcosine oxidase gamma subunit